MKNVILILATLLTLLPSGCGSKGSSYSLLSSGQHFVQSSAAFNGKMDIVFVVDDQPSMSSFQAELVASFATFMQVFQSKGYDFKIVVETTSGYLADPTLNGYSSTNSALADWNTCSGSTCSGVPVITPTDTNLLSDFAINAKPNKNTAGQDPRAFSSMRYGLQTPDSTNSGFLRSDSFLAVVFVDNTDDFSDNTRCSKCGTNLQYNDPNIDPISTYISFLNSITGTSGATARYNVSAMTQTSTPCQGNNTMTRIMSLVNQTNGILGDICQSNFGSSMSQIASKIAELSSRFFLQVQPVVSSITVSINGVSIAQDSANGWSYDSTANAVEFHGSSIPAQGASIDINFDPASLTF